MRKTIAIIAILSFTAGLLISCAAPTRLETDYGTSYKLQKYNQIANPDAEKNLKPVEGLDGQAAAAGAADLPPSPLSRPSMLPRR